jgi:hypothetical protein
MHNELCSEIIGGARALLLMKFTPMLLTSQDVQKIHHNLSGSYQLWQYSCLNIVASRQENVLQK